MNNEMLILKIMPISEKFELVNQKTGGYFNIFEIASIATKEVMICRVISELLSPKGGHCQGALYLSLFLSIVLKIDINEEEIKSARVSPEYVIDEKRRIDIVIQIKQNCITLLHMAISPPNIVRMEWFQIPKGMKVLNVFLLPLIL